MTVGTTAAVHGGKATEAGRGNAARMKQIGRYRLLQRLRGGGVGAVLLGVAQQESGCAVNSTEPTSSAADFHEDSNERRPRPAGVGCSSVRTPAAVVAVLLLVALEADGGWGLSGDGAAPDSVAGAPSSVPRSNREEKTGFRDGLRSGGESPQMVLIPAGEFRMGSPSSAQGQYGHELPQHGVRIDQPFALGRTPVTFAEYDAFASATGRSRPDDGGWGRGDRPVINVSWHDAVAYTEWLSAQTGKHYRLPSEAEWEYAVRGGTTTARWWGEELGRNHANCDGCGSRWDNDRTNPIGRFSPNPFGLYDVLGNVWEWTQDCWNENYRGAPEDGSPWLSGDCSHRVLRGGSWVSDPWFVRSDIRDGEAATLRSGVNGFRVAREP